MHIVFSAIAGLLVTISVPSHAAAAVFDGPTSAVQDGVEAVRQGVGGLFKGDLWTIMLNILLFVLNFVALLAVIMIVAAGILLIVGSGTDESKNRAKTMITYTVIGLLVIIFARVIVAFVLKTIPHEVL